MTDPFLTPQDLQARGWTLGMIRTLLAPHDHERWTNKLGYHMARSMKLYLATRVEQVETTEAFVRARERAGGHQVLMRKAAQTRQVLEAQTLAQYEALPLPAVRLLPGRSAGNTAQQEEFWRLHLQDFYLWQREQDRLLAGLPRELRRAAEYRVLQRYRTTVYQAYGWFEDAERQPLSALARPEATGGAAPQTQRQGPDLAPDPPARPHHH